MIFKPFILVDFVPDSKVEEGSICHYGCAEPRDGVNMCLELREFFNAVAFLWGHWKFVLEQKHFAAVDDTHHPPRFGCRSRFLEDDFIQMASQELKNNLI